MTLLLLAQLIYEPTVGCGWAAFLVVFISFSFMFGEAAGFRTV
jgi:hypothetical protein